MDRLLAKIDKIRKETTLNAILKQVLRLSVEKLAERGHIKIIKDIGQNNFDKNRIEIGLIYAAKGGQVKALKLFKKWGATSYDWALLNASGCGKIEAMKLLKKMGSYGL